MTAGWEADASETKLWGLSDERGRGISLPPYPRGRSRVAPGGDIWVETSSTVDCPRDTPSVLAQQWAASCLPPLAICLHQVSWVLSLEFLEGQVGVGVSMGSSRGPDWALPERASPVPRLWDRRFFPSLPQSLLQG